ncbi:MAG: hypothetical protein ACM34K_04390 [Bacillota bacterium]
MDNQILSVQNKGIPNKEFLLIEVINDNNLGEYIVHDNSYKDGMVVSNKLRHLFEFPQKLVRKGELIALFTGKRNSLGQGNPSGMLVHHFYWELDQPIWNDDNDIAVLVKVAERRSRSV